MKHVSNTDHVLAIPTIAAKVLLSMCEKAWSTLPLKKDPEVVIQDPPLNPSDFLLQVVGLTVFITTRKGAVRPTRGFQHGEVFT
jgi:hypothetical protein